MGPCPLSRCQCEEIQNKIDKNTGDGYFVNISIEGFHNLYYKS